MQAAKKDGSTRSGWCVHHPRLRHWKRVVELQSVSGGSCSWTRSAGMPCATFVEKIRKRFFEVHKQYAFAGSLKDVQQRKCTPFAQDFRHVHIPHHWDGQHVLRRLAGMELEHATVVARRIELPLLDGPLVVEVMRESILRLW